MKWNATLNRAQVEIDEVIAERLTVEAMEIDGDSAEVSVAWVCTYRYALDPNTFEGVGLDSEYGVGFCFRLLRQNGQWLICDIASGDDYDYDHCPSFRASRPPYAKASISAPIGERSTREAGGENEPFPLPQSYIIHKDSSPKWAVFYILGCKVAQQNAVAGSIPDAEVFYLPPVWVASTSLFWRRARRWPSFQRKRKIKRR